MLFKPHELEERFRKLGSNFELLLKLQYRNQKEYIRKRLRAIDLLWQGKCRQEVSDKVYISLRSLITWIKVLVENGLERGLTQLVSAKKLEKEGKLKKEYQQVIIKAIKEETPLAYGYEQNIFTGKILVEIVTDKWGIEVTNQTIYNILHRNNYSYQRAHRDYENADPESQKKYGIGLKKRLETNESGVKRVFFDEFSVSNRPTTFYGWARKNTKFKVPSNESKKRERLNGLLAIDADTGKEYLKLTKAAKTEDIAQFFHELSIETQKCSFHKLEVILDNNSTHKDKMRYELLWKNKSNPQLQDFQIEFIDTPTYSPDFNLAEYIIHQIRLKILHHLPSDITLVEIENKLVKTLKKKQLQTREQVQKTINHILKLAKVQPIDWNNSQDLYCEI